MNVSFVPFNSSQMRIQGPQAIPLKPVSPIMDLPDDERAILLPDETKPKSFNRSFKDIYLHKREELEKSAEGMEAILVRQALKAMRSTIPEPEGEDDMFGSGSHATQMFKQMMDDELAEKIAKNGEFGIANTVFKSQINGLTQEFAAQLESGETAPFGIPLRR